MEHCCLIVIMYVCRIVPRMQTDGSHEMYSGPLKAVPMRAFLDAYALKEPLTQAAAQAPGGGADGMPGEVVLRTLDASNLTEVDRQDAMWLLAFYKAAGGFVGEVLCLACCGRLRLAATSSAGLAYGGQLLQLLLLLTLLLQWVPPVHPRSSSCTPSCCS
jgi:hypothetical protein